MATPSRSLPRSASGMADPPSPFSSNPAHQPVSTPTTPAAASASSFGCIMATPTDTPPATPKDKSKAAPASAAAASYASLWSPRKFMQRAARAFRTSSRSRRGMKITGDEPTSITGKGSYAPSIVVSVDAGLPANDSQGGTAEANMQEEHHHLEAVPEKIIHEANHQAPVATEPEVCEKTADGKENGADEEKDEPNKGAALAPDAAADANADTDVTDKFMVKEAIKKREAEAETKKEAMRRFQGSQVKTAMEARPESKQPRRREVARSNDVIEDARTKLLDKQCSRVKALVGAFETVMDAKHAAGAGKPQHHHSKSA